MIDTKYIQAYRDRTFNSFYNENPKSYALESKEQGLKDFNKLINNDFELGSDVSSKLLSDEVSPYSGEKLNISYSSISINELITNANKSSSSFPFDITERFKILKSSLDRLSSRFFELAYATMHTTGQSFMMSFQASGPHAADRALEALVVAFLELSEFPTEVDWIKDFGKFKLELRKDYLPISKGIGLVVGCSTFPTWNSVTGLYANLMCGNPVIVKPHPSSILPMAIFVDEIQKELERNGVDPNLVQLAPDTLDKPITKQLAEHSDVKLIDYTGGNEFGNYIESLSNKTTFTEKAGVNSCIIDSFKDVNTVCSNLAFSASLYSGQMCTAPQNIFVPESGIQTDDGNLSFDEFLESLKNAISNLAHHPKAGHSTLGAIQSKSTEDRLNMANNGDNVVLHTEIIANPEFSSSRTFSPIIRVYNEGEMDKFGEECFGPIINIVKTSSRGKSLYLAKQLGQEKGALTCLCYTLDEEYMKEVKSEMNKVFVPVSFNFVGAAFVNQHAAFSDLHVTGGNAAGNASFTNREYVAKRFVWVGNRYMK